MYRFPSRAPGRLARSLLLAGSTLLVMAGAHAAPPGHAAGSWAEGRILVQGAPGLSEEQLARILERQGAKSQAKIRGIGVHMVQVPARAEERIAAALARHPHVQFAELDMLVPPGEFIPADPRYPDQWHLPKIGAPAAWDSVSGDGIIIAILDTGVDPHHYDLAAKLLPGYNAVDGGSDWSDIHGHGTSVAGVAAAIANNGAGVASVAWGATLLPVRVSNHSEGYAYFSDIARGLTWAADQGARVANISYGATPSYAVSSAARYMKEKGGLVVVSAGNSGTNPGFSDNPDLISVSATTSSDALASWSSYGAYIDVAAPGAGLLTTRMNDGIGNASGTSFSSPATAGVVALIMSANPHLSPAEVEQILKDSALDLGVAGRDDKFGHGRVDAAAAVRMALSTVSQPQDDTAPDVSIALSPNTQLQDLVSITVNATDDVGVTTVELLVDGKTIGTATQAPYLFSWDTTEHPNGSMTLEARAHDAAGNTGSSNIKVQVDNVIALDDDLDGAGIGVAIVSPADGDSVEGGVNIYVETSDNQVADRLSCYVNGALIGVRDGTRRIRCRWDTRQFTDGVHHIEAVAHDAAGNESRHAIQLRLGG